MVIELIKLAIDPTVAERCVDRFGFGYGIGLRALLGEFNPEPLRVRGLRS
jgi:hypothetical protein